MNNRLHLKLERGKYKYVSLRPITFHLSQVIYRNQIIRHPFIEVSAWTVHIKEGYAWDGATGAPDDNFLEASMVHDALYQLMKLGLLPPGHRKTYDKTMYHTALRYGMGKTLGKR